jgi:hypothetical protein
MRSLQSGDDVVIVPVQRECLTYIIHASDGVQADIDSSYYGVPHLMRWSRNAGTPEEHR